MHAYEAMYDKTPVGKIEIKEIAPRIALEASVQSPYFGGNNNLFRTLFRYISNTSACAKTTISFRSKSYVYSIYLGYFWCENRFYW